MKQKYLITGVAVCNAPSTLLIPDFLTDEFNKRKRQFGNIQSLFHFIVNRDHRIFRCISPAKRGRTKYQSIGMKLARRDFYPKSEDWEKFRLQAYLLKMSMTMLFVRLLMDWEGFEGGEDGVPIQNQHITLSHSLIFTPTFTYLEIQRIIR